MKVIQVMENTKIFFIITITSTILILLNYKKFKFIDKFKNKLENSLEYHHELYIFQISTLKLYLVSIW